MRPLRFLSAAAVLSLALLAPARAQEKPGDLGVGAIVGTPFGASAKYFLSREHAVDFGMGVDRGDFAAHADYLVHLQGLLPQPPKGRLPLFLGMGAKIKDEHDMFFGVRFVAGVSYFFPDHPLEAFAEIAPILRLAPGADGDIDGAIGLRYYFAIPLVCASCGG
ncbi:MAG: hypothetical protein WCU88_11780 [Elusimicrobiota bacterium]